MGQNGGPRPETTTTTAAAEKATDASGPKDRRGMRTALGTKNFQERIESRLTGDHFRILDQESKNFLYPETHFRDHGFCIKRPKIWAESFPEGNYIKIRG